MTITAPRPWCSEGNNPADCPTAMISVRDDLYRLVPIEEATDD